MVRGTVEVDEWLRALAAHAEDTDLIPVILIMAHSCHNFQF